MSGYFLVVKLLLSYMFKRDKTKKTSKGMIAIYVVLGFSYLMLAFYAVLFVAMYGKAFREGGMISEFITVVLVIGAAVVILFGVVSMLSTLYFSRDTEFFLSLPIKFSVVYMAKLTVVYVTSLFSSALFLIPCLITIGVIMGLTPLYYIVIPFAVALTPAIPLFLASIIAIPIMYLVSFVKNRGATSSILVIVLFGLFFVFYYYIITRFSSPGGESSTIVLTEGMKKVIMVVVNVFYPLYALAKFTTFTPIGGLGVGVSELLNLLIYIVSIAALATLAIAISSKIYRRGAAKQLEGAVTNRKKLGKYSSSNAIKSLAKKEWLELVRTPSFAFQCLNCIVITPIIVAFMSLMNNAGSGNNKIASQIMWFVSLGIMIMGVGMNVGSATSVTREGDKFYYMKLIPVSYKTQIRAKSLVYYIISLVTVLVSMIIASIFNFNIINVIFSLGFLLMYGYAFVCFSMWVDLLRPKLDWVTPNEAVKNNRNATIPVLINMGASSVFLILPIIISAILPTIIGSIIIWSFMYATVITLVIIFHNLLYKNCDRLIERIE